MPELSRIDTIVQFTAGSNVAWNDVNVPVPVGAIIIDTVNKTVKEGDGVTLYADLPVCLDYNFNGSTSGAVRPVGADAGAIAICDNLMYSSSQYKLSQILNTINSYQVVANDQQTRADGLTASEVIATISEGTVDGTIVVVANGKYAPGDRTIAQLINDLIANASVVGSKMHIDDLVFYSDNGLTKLVETPNNLAEGSKYWCKVTGFHDTTEIRNVDFGLATTNPNITIKNSQKQATSSIIGVVYGGTGTDIFNNITIDKNDNIIAVGYTTSEGTNHETLVVKFDADLNILFKKRYGGSGQDAFNGVAVDSANNIIVTGYTYSEGGPGGVMLVVKFDANLNILFRKYFKMVSSINNSYAVAIDSNDNIFTVGYSSSQNGVLYETAIIKLDPSLNIVAQKYLVLSGAVGFWEGIAIDSNGNVFCAGYWSGEGNDYDATIVKFSNDLSTTLAKKRYYGSNADVFQCVIIDADNNVICSGHTKSEGSGHQDNLIVKFNNDLSSILARKVFGNSEQETLRGLALAQDGGIFAIGYRTISTLNSAVILKLDSNLNLISGKAIGTSTTYGQKGIVGTNGDVYMTISTDSAGSGGTDAGVFRFPSDLPVGNFTGAILNTLSITDHNPQFSNSNLTFANSAATFNTATFTATNSTLTLAASALNLKRDVIVAARLTEPTSLITAVYSSDGDDKFQNAITDIDGNIIAVGSTGPNSGYAAALIVKFDADFNPIARKIYSSPYTAGFMKVLVDSSNDVYCIGYVDTAGVIGSEIYDALVVKFDSSLTNIIVHKTYGSAGSDIFQQAGLDPAGNIICVGHTYSEGSGNADAFIVKFNSNLAIVAKKRYGSTANDSFRGIAFDASGNAIVVGYTNSETAFRSALIIKFDANLNIILRKIYTSSVASTEAYFGGVAVSSNNNIYCCGSITTAAKEKALFVKFDSNLNVVSNKVYGSADTNTRFNSVGIDSSNNIFCVGRTDGEGAGDSDALIVKFNNNLAILGRKTYGSIGYDSEMGCFVNQANDVIIAGYGIVDGTTAAIITKLPNALPKGVYTNKYLTSLILADSKLTLSDDNATVNNSNLTMADSALLLTNSSLTLGDAAGSVIKDHTIMDAIGSVFEVNIKSGTITTGDTLDVTFNISTNDGEALVTKDINVTIEKANILVSLYGGSTNDESFYGTIIDSNDNIICCGYTASEGLGQQDLLIVKFDPNLNILAKKRYGGTSYDVANAITVDYNDNVIVVGFTYSETVGLYDALIVKFDPNLNILSKYRHSGTYVDDFVGVAVDSNNNIICVGYTDYTGAGNYDALIVKFDPEINKVLAEKRFSGALMDIFQDVAIGANDNIIAVGYTTSEGAGDNECIIVKFDSNLNVLFKKRYGGTGSDVLVSVAVDSQDNIFAAGWTTSETLGGHECLVIKFSSNLNILAKKRYYSGTGVEMFRDVTVDMNDHVICVGNTRSEGLGDYDAVLVKFDNNLSNILAKKRYGGTGIEYFFETVIDSNNNIICSGNTYSEGAGNSDALVIKFPSIIPSGTFVGNKTFNLTLADSNLTLSDVNLTLADSTLTLINSTLTLTNSNMTLADSNLIQEKDVILV